MMVSTTTMIRRLADALSRQRQADEHGIYCAVPRQAVDAAIRHLRAQADAQPVAWIAHNLTTGHVKWTTDRCRARGWTRSVNLRVKPLYAHPAPAVPAGWKWVPVEPTPEMIDAGCDVDAHAEVVSKFAVKPGVHDPEAWVSAGELLSVQYRAMLTAAPAAPQAEPFVPHARCKTPDKCRRDGVCFDAWACSSGPAPQAEPKRNQPLLDLLAVIHCDGGDRTEAVGIEQSIKDAQAAVCALKGRLAEAEPKPTPASGDDLSVYKGMVDSYRNDEPTGAPYGIIDPDYGRVYTIARNLAWEEGYAIGLHGSFTRDLDMIAVPWAERACEAEHLIRRIVDATGLKLRNGVAVKPHGRRAWTLLFPAFGDPRFVDLSVMPRIGGSDAE